MQRKHLIAFTLATIFMLLGFNIINSNRHEQSRAQSVSSDTLVVAEVNSSIDDTSDLNSSVAQPLGEQPKVIIDNATTQIEQAQQIEAQRLQQMDNAQQ